MYANNKASWWFYFVGLVIVLGTHLYMLVSGLTINQMTGHALLNLLAGILLATGWLIRKT
ncbi:MAG TPA: hypothetical protein VJI73_02290 [Candidatus Paceibacterota bacterium]|nr:MAG: hypothetical protein A3D92_20205 [Bacteroidetes bacterium RIFCSPHIGHO2_02_FULL_44_7]